MTSVDANGLGSPGFRIGIARPAALTRLQMIWCGAGFVCGLAALQFAGPPSPPSPIWPDAPGRIPTASAPVSAKLGQSLDGALRGQNGQDTAAECAALVLEPSTRAVRLEPCPAGNEALPVVTEAARSDRLLPVEPPATSARPAAGTQISSGD